MTDILKIDTLSISKDGNFSLPPEYIDQLSYDKKTSSTGSSSRGSTNNICSNTNNCEGWNSQCTNTKSCSGTNWTKCTNPPPPDPS